MKKMHAILLTAAACLLLTACDGEAEQTTVAITTTEPSAATEETTEPSVERDDISSFEGFAGDTLYLSDAAEIVKAEGLEALTAKQVLDYGGRIIVTYDGFAYAAKSRGVSFNSEEHEIIDSKFVSPGLPEPFDHSYGIVRVGDSFGGLTVQTASVVIMFAEGSSEPYLYDAQLSFDGEITLTGYISAATQTEGYIDEGDIDFLADGASYGTELPLIRNAIYEDLTDLACPTYFTGDFYYSSDIPKFSLGSAINGYPDTDISPIPDDGSFEYVTVTLNELSMRSSEMMGTSIRAHILSVEENRR